MKLESLCSDSFNLDAHIVINNPARMGVGVGDFDTTVDFALLPSTERKNLVKFHMPKVRIRPGNNIPVDFSTTLRMGAVEDIAAMVQHIGFAKGNVTLFISAPTKVFLGAIPIQYNLKTELDVRNSPISCLSLYDLIL